MFTTVYKNFLNFHRKMWANLSFKGEVRRGMGSQAAEYTPVPTPTPPIANVAFATFPLKGWEKWPGKRVTTVRGRRPLRFLVASPWRGPAAVWR